jgi:hypothetical protein
MSRFQCRFLCHNQNLCGRLALSSANCGALCSLLDAALFGESIGYTLSSSFSLLLQLKAARCSLQICEPRGYHRLAHLQNTSRKVLRFSTLKIEISNRLHHPLRVDCHVHGETQAGLVRQVFQVVATTRVGWVVAS